METYFPGWVVPYLIIAGFILAGLIMVYGLYNEVQVRRRARREQREMAEFLEQERKINPVIVDWQPTGRVNMVGPYRLMLSDEAKDEPSDFILLIEEKRLVADISGAPTLQTQWRKASRRDATRVVRMYNEKNPAEGPGEKLAERVSGADYSLDPQYQAMPPLPSWPVTSPQAAE